MATIDSVEKLLELIRRSNLVIDEDLSQSLATIKGAATPEQMKNLEYVAEQLVQSGLVTRWQCDKLLDGRSKGFFLGKYKLLGHLGTGGMSAVYLAEHTKMHRRVAVKVLPQSRIDDSSYLARFYLEARAAAALDHANIVKAYDIDNEGNIHYLVMEYVEGRDLQHIVKEDGPLDFDRAANYMLQSANGLEHAHEEGFVHRDIKPANLLVDLKGTVKVLDMGLAKFTDTSKQASLTVAHDENVLGTADYLAPEQAENSHNVDSRADIYSLGCTLYFLLTGHPPFPDGTLVQRLMCHRSKTPPSILVDRPDAPQSLVDIAMRMMAKLPADRFQTAADVSEALRSWLTANASNDGSSKLGGRPSDSSGRMAVARGAREVGGRSGAGSPPARNVGGGGGRSRERSPQIEDTVSDMDRGTMKGNSGTARPKAGDSSKFRRGLPVARPIEKNPFDFVTDEPVAQAPTDAASEAPTEREARQSDSKRVSNRRGADSKVGSKKGIKAAAAAPVAEELSPQERIRAKRKAAKSPKWLLPVFAVGFLVTIVVLGAGIYKMTHTKPPEPPPAIESATKGKDGKTTKRKGDKKATDDKKTDDKQAAAKTADDKSTPAGDSTGKGDAKGSDDAKSKDDAKARDAAKASAADKAGK